MSLLAYFQGPGASTELSTVDREPRSVIEVGGRKDKTTRGPWQQAPTSTSGRILTSVSVQCAFDAIRTLKNTARCF